MGIYFFGSIRKKIKTENLDTIYATLVKENKNILLVKHSNEEYQIFSDRALEDE